MLYETQAWISSPRFSRDGQKIAFIDHPGVGDDRGRIGLADLSGNVRFLTEPFASMAHIAWSPANDAVWFSATPAGIGRSIYSVDLRGRQKIVDSAPVDMVLADVSPSGKALIVRNSARRGLFGTRPGDETERDLSWLDWSRSGALSLDGRWLLFEEQGAGGGQGYSVYLRNTDGSPAVRLGAGYANDLSRDGQWALSASLIEPDRLDILPRGPGEPRTLRLPGFQIIGGQWFPGDQRLLVQASEPGHLTRLYVIDSKGGTPKPISPEGVGFATTISPDGTLVAAMLSGGPAVISPVEGGDPRPVAGSVAGDNPAIWSSDGRALFVVVKAAPGARIDRIDIATGQRTTVRSLMPADRAGLLDIGFILLSTDARSYVYSYRRILSTLYQVDGLR